MADKNCFSKAISYQASAKGSTDLNETKNFSENEYSEDEYSEDEYSENEYREKEEIMAFLRRNKQNTVTWAKANWRCKFISTE